MRHVLCRYAFVELLDWEDHRVMPIGGKNCGMVCVLSVGGGIVMIFR